MPNATLVSAALVQMLLGTLSGTSITETVEQLTKDMHFPQCYLITEERLKQAMTLPSVAYSDEFGLLGNQSFEMLESAGVVGLEGGRMEGGKDGKAAKDRTCDIM